MPQPPINPNQLGAFMFGGGPLGPQTPAFEMPQDPANMASLYGILAQHADDPAKIGTDYAARMQNQQQINAQYSPFMQMLQVYGKVNPHDFEAKSIQDFHNELQQGNFRPDLLVRHDPYTTVEQTAVKDARKTAHDAEMAMGRMASIASRFEAIVPEAPLTGVAGWLRETALRVLGEQDNLTQLRNEFNAVINTAVINSLPPGVASDRDIELARKGWPSDLADPEHIAANLRVMRTVEAMKYAQAVYTHDYISSNRDERHLLREWRKHKDWFVPMIMEEMGIPMGLAEMAGVSGDAGASLMQPDLSGNGGAAGASGIPQLPEGMTLEEAMKLALERKE